MIVIRIELWSAVTGEKTELARMRIVNRGTDTGTRSLRDYDGVTFRGRDRAALDRQVPQHRGKLDRYPSQALHLWNLVADMLKDMGYGREKAGR